MTAAEADHDALVRLGALVDAALTADHDLLRQLEERLAALDRLIASQRVDDQRALEIAQTAVREALVLAAQQMDGRLEKLNEFRGALADAQATMMPRLEANLLIDGVNNRVEALTNGLTARLEGVVKNISDLGQVIVALRSSLQGQDQGQTDQLKTVERNRNLIFALIGVAIAIVALTFSLYGRPKNTPTPATTPTTTATTTR